MRHIRPQGTIGFVIAALAAASLACTLTGTNAEPTTSIIPSPVPATSTLVPTAFVFIPSATPLPTATPIPVMTPTPVCFVQANWPVYVVQPGDTLSNLAARIGSNVDTLAVANCLPDPNQIYVGQGLFVPMIPPAPEPTATVTSLPTVTANPAFGDVLVVEPRQLGTNGQPVTYAQSVLVNAGRVERALRVKFFVNDHANGGVTMFIGQDDNPSDGASVNYTFPHVGNFTFLAVAENNTASTPSTVFTIQFDPASVPVAGSANLLSITPNLGFDGATYTLPAYSTVMIGWSQAPANALRVEFLLLPPGASAESGGTVIGTDLYPSDGAQTAWPVPGGALGRIEGLAYMPDGSQIASRPAEFRANQ